MSESGRRRGETSREAILTAAEIVFAEHGFDGARVDTIANVSGYDKKLIFRYFGDKLGLYVEVLKHADRELNVLLAGMLTPWLAGETLTSQAQGFRTFLETLVRMTFDYLVEHPRFLRILTWEMAEGWQTYAQIASQFSTEESGQYVTLFQEARNAGLLRSDFSPTIQLLLILHLCQSYLASLTLYQTLLPGEDMSSAAVLARAREHIVALVVAGMMIDPPQSKSEK
ncbi:MAG TPA: TetR family transcriptional regulator [Ktedonobacteraceae bacterium]